MIRRAFLAAGAAACASCGYRIAGHADVLPKTVNTIAVPVFGNTTNRYKLSEKLPAAITREFIARTRYKVVGDAEDADAVLNGSVVNYFAFPHVTDPTTGRATAIQISVVMTLSLTERKTGAVLFSRPSMEFRQRYEISSDQQTYFEESDIALERLSRDVARTVVSAVLETF